MSKNTGLVGRFVAWQIPTHELLVEDAEAMGYLVAPHLGEPVLYAFSLRSLVGGKPVATLLYELAGESWQLSTVHMFKAKPAAADVLEAAEVVAGKLGLIEIDAEFHHNSQRTWIVR